MRAVLQRVSNAEVAIGQEIAGAIDLGLLILLGIESEDGQEDIEWLVSKILAMRIFSDEEGKMNLNVKDVGGDLLIVSQFTLHASTKKGNRPSFIKAAPPEQAKAFYSDFINHCRKEFQGKIQTGEFGAMMDVSLVNNGPVTIIIDSKHKQ